MLPLAMLAGFLGPCYTQLVRGIDTSLVSLCAESIAGGIEKKLGLSTRPSDARLAAAMPDFLLALLNQFPTCYKTSVPSPLGMLDELDMQILFVFGSDPDRARVERDRIHLIGRAAPTLDKLLRLETSPVAQHAGVRQAITAFIPTRNREPLHLLLAQLEEQLALWDHAISHTIATTPSPTMDSVLTSLVNTRLALTGSGSGSGGPTPPADADATTGGPQHGGPTSRDLTAKALTDATNDIYFQGVFQDIKKLDLSSEDKQLEALALAFESPSVLLHRYLAFGESWLVSRHELFSLLKPLLFRRGLHFGRLQAVRSDGKIPKLARNFAWGDRELLQRAKERQESRSIRFGATRSQLEFFLAGLFSLMDWVNLPGGYLELDALLNDNTAEYLEARHHLCTVAALEGIQRFGNRTFVAFGYPHTSRRGHTWHTLLQVYIDYMKQGRNLSGPRREAWNSLSVASLHSDIALAQELHLGRLTHPNPLSQRLEFLIPFESAGVKDLQDRLEETENVVTLQRALGIGRQDQTPLRVEGVYGDRLRDRPPTPGVRDRTPRDRSRLSPSPSPGRSLLVLPKTTGRDASDAGGSRASLVEYNAGGTKLAIGRPSGVRELIDVAAMAQHFSVPHSSKCWESFMSTKSGDARFSLCTRWGQPGHESPHSAAHQPPLDFDATVARTKFSRQLGPGARMGSSAASSNRNSRSRSRSPASAEKRRADRGDSRSPNRTPVKRATIVAPATAKGGGEAS